MPGKNKGDKKKGPPPNKTKPQISKNISAKKRSVAQPDKPNRWNKYWKFLAGFILVATFAITVYTIWPKSDKEQFDQDNTIKGKVKSESISEYKTIQTRANFTFTPKNIPPILNGVYIKDLNKYPEITFEIAGNQVQYTPEQLSEGVNPVNAALVRLPCQPINLLIKSKGDRVYVSAIFVDFDTGHEIGVMDYNHWTLYKGTFLDYHPDPKEKKFEVIDKRGDIVFSILFSLEEDKPFLRLAGYFADPRYILVLNNEKVSSEKLTSGGIDCFAESDTNWKQSALIAMRKIKSVFQ
jgi:hypothetical protein